MLDRGAQQRPVGAAPALVRQADAAGVEQKRSVHDALVAHVRMRGHDRALLDAVEKLAYPLDRGRLRDQLLVAPRRPVAERRRAETLDLDADVLAERRDEVARRVVVALGHEALALARVIRNAPEEPQELALGVAAYEERTLAERQQQRDRLLGQRPPGEVAAEDDEVGLRSPDLVQNRLERRSVAVDVGQDGDAPRSWIGGSHP